MKQIFNNSKLVLSALTATLIMGCASMPQRSLAGERDRGGGNTVSVVPAQLYQIEEAVKDSKLIARLFFNTFTSIEVTSKGSIIRPYYGAEKIVKDLFDQKRDIYWVLKNLKIELKQDGPCLDEDGKEKDGSVLSKNESTICISTQRILAKSNSVTVTQMTLALIIHEASHLVGINEEDAIKLQTYAQDVLSNKSSFLAYELEFNYINQLYALTLHKIPQLSKLSQCTSMGVALSTGYNIKTFASQSMSVTNVKQKIKIHEIQIRLTNLSMGYCTGDDLYKQQYLSAFKNNQQFTDSLALAQALKLPMKDLKKFTLRNTSNFNSDEFIQEFTSIINEVTQMYKSAKAKNFKY